MKWWQQALISVGTGVATTLTIDAIYMVRVKRQAFEHALSLAGYKGIINLGSGQRRSHLARTIALTPDVMVNVDRTPNGVPGFLQYNLEDTPYPWPDKAFDVAYCSHTLEHLRNWEDALCEMCRIADFVVVVLPNPISPTNLLHPGHLQHFTHRDMSHMEQQYPNLRVFY